MLKNIFWLFFSYLLGQNGATCGSLELEVPVIAGKEQQPTVMAVTKREALRQYIKTTSKEFEKKEKFTFSILSSSEVAIHHIPLGNSISNCAISYEEWDIVESFLEEASKTNFDEPNLPDERVEELIKLYIKSNNLMQTIIERLKNPKFLAETQVGAFVKSYKCKDSSKFSFLSKVMYDMKSINLINSIDKEIFSQLEKKGHLLNLDKTYFEVLYKSKTQYKEFYNEIRDLINRFVDLNYKKLTKKSSDIILRSYSDEMLSQSIKENAEYCLKCTKDILLLLTKLEEPRKFLINEIRSKTHDQGKSCTKEELSELKFMKICFRDATTHYKNFPQMKEEILLEYRSQQSEHISKKRRLQ